MLKDLKEQKIMKALNYVNNMGFSVIPVDSRNKGGAFIKWSLFQKRCPTKKEIRNWWSNEPKAGIAIITGKISGIIVLDVDPRHGGLKTIEDKHIPPTVTVETGGGGFHYYYKYPSQLDGDIKNFTGENVELPGLDLRADGGFVYAPPSVHPSENKYKFANGLGPDEVDLKDVPEWLLEVIKNRKKSKYKFTSKKEWQEKWKGVIEGNRNNTCSQLAGKLAYAEVPKAAAENLLKEWNRKNVDENGNYNPMPEKEVEKVVNSIYRTHHNNNDKNEINDKDNEIGKFRPSEVARRVFEHLKKEKKRIWAYVPELDMMYAYNLNEGYWKKFSEQYLRSTIRKVLCNINKDWESKYKIEEVFSAFRHRTIKTKHHQNFTEISEFEKNYINTKSGMLEWKSGKIKSHKYSYFSMFQIPVKHVPKAKCPKWKNVLKEWVLDKKTRKFLQEFVGYCLIPDTSQQVSLFLHGAGSNGKSTFLEVLKELFGNENLTSIPLNRLSDRFETSKIQHKLVNICPDIDPTYLEKTGILKTLIAGETLRGEYKYRESFDFKPVARLIFSANELPVSRDKTEAWYRRIKIVKFPNKFTKNDPGFDPDLKQKLKNEIPGIFQWALEGLKRLKNQGYFTQSKTMKVAKRKYQAENDSVRAFADLKIEKTSEDEPEYVIPKKRLYEKYRMYCEKSGLMSVSRRKFSRRMNQLGFESAKRRLHCENSIVAEIESTQRKSVRCFIKIEFNNRL